MNIAGDQGSTAAPTRRLIGPTFNDVNVGFKDGPVDYLLMFYTAYFAFQLSQTSPSGKRPDVTHAYYVESISIYKEPALRLSLYHEYLVATIRSINPRDTQRHYFLFERTSGKLNKDQKREEFVPEKHRDGSWPTEWEEGVGKEAGDSLTLPTIPERRPEEKILISKFKGVRRLDATVAPPTPGSIFAAAADLASSSSESSSANLLLAEDSFQIIDSPKRGFDDVEVARLRFGEPPETLSGKSRTTTPLPQKPRPRTQSLNGLDSPSPAPAPDSHSSSFRSSRPTSSRKERRSKHQLPPAPDKLQFSQSAPGDIHLIPSRPPSIIDQRFDTRSLNHASRPATTPYLVPPSYASNISSTSSLSLSSAVNTPYASASALSDTSYPRQLPSSLPDDFEPENSVAVEEDNQAAEQANDDETADRSEPELQEETSIGIHIENHDGEITQSDQGGSIYESSPSDSRSNDTSSDNQSNGSMSAISALEDNHFEGRSDDSLAMDPAPSQFSLSRVPTTSTESSGKTHTSFIFRMILRRKSSSATQMYDSLPIAPQRPHIYLYELVVLACRLHKCKSLYRIFTRNCYWFVGMIFHVLRRFTKADAFLVNDNGQRNLLGPSDEVHKWINGGRMGTFMRAITVVKAPRLFTIDAIMRKWHGAVTRFHDDIEINRRNNQADSRAYLDRVVQNELQTRDEVEKKRFEEATKRAEEEKTRAEEAEGRIEEEKRRAEEEKRRAEEAEGRVEEEKKRVEEEKKRVEEEKKRVEEEKKRVEAEKKRADEAEQEKKRIEQEREEERRKFEEERRKFEEEKKKFEEETRKRVEDEYLKRLEEHRRPPSVTPENLRNASSRS